MYVKIYSSFFPIALCSTEKNDEIKKMFWGELQYTFKIS